MNDFQCFQIILYWSLNILNLYLRNDQSWWYPCWSTLILFLELLGRLLYEQNRSHHTWCIFQHFFCNAAVFGHIINHRMFRFRERVEKNSFLSTHTSDSSKFIACFCDDHFTVHSKNGSSLWFTIRLYTLLEYCNRSFLCPRRKQILIHPQYHSFYTILSIKNIVVH